MGYLGYSNLVKYSNHGINVLATDFGSETTRLDEIKKNNFPSNKLKNDFIHHKFSKPKFSNLNIVKNNKNVFNKKIALHIMCNSESLYFHKNTKDILLNWLINNKTNCPMCREYWTSNIIYKNLDNNYNFRNIFYNLFKNIFY